MTNETSKLRARNISATVKLKSTTNNAIVSRGDEPGAYVEAWVRVTDDSRPEAKAVKVSRAFIAYLIEGNTGKIKSIRAGQFGPEYRKGRNKAWIADLEGANAVLHKYLGTKPAGAGVETIESTNLFMAQEIMGPLKRLRNLAAPRFPGLTVKIRSAIKSAKGAVRNARAHND